MKKFFIVTLCLFLSLPAFRTAQACECLPITDERAATIINGAALVFEGRIMDLEQREQPEENFHYESNLPVTDNPLYAKLRLKVLTLYHGQTDAERIEAYIDTMTDCGYPAQVGDVMDFVLVSRDDILVQVNNCDMPPAGQWNTLNGSGQNREHTQEE